MAKKVTQNKDYFLMKPRKQKTFSGKKYAGRKAYRGQGR